MNLSRSRFLVFSSFFLLIWFRFESFFHSHMLFNAGLIVACIAILLLLLKSMRSREGRVFLFLWLLVIGVLIADFVQTSFLGGYSESRFLKKLDEVTSIVQEKTTVEAGTLRKNANEVVAHLRGIKSLTPEGIFVHMQDALGNSAYGWAVYDARGLMLAWKGQFPDREIQIANGGEEITVYRALHQQFLRLKTTPVIANIPFILVVNKPIAADYGIHNQYLRNFNLLTDDLPIRPNLLYNSQVSAPRSTDLIIKRFSIGGDFSVSLLFNKNQYGEYLAHRNFRLHWWFELISLLFILIGVIYCFFEFVGTSGKEVSSKSLWRSWATIGLIAFAGLLLLPTFTALKSSAFFRVNGTAYTWWAQIASPGGLFTSAFLILNIVWSFALLLWKLKPKIFEQSEWIRVGFFGVTGLVSVILVQLYLNFMKSVLIPGSYETSGQPLLQVDLLRLSQMLGTLWLDLAFLAFIGILLAIGMSSIRRNVPGSIRVFGIMIVVGGIFWIFQRGQDRYLLVTSLGLFFGTGILVYFLPWLGNRFERLNLFSRFLVLLLSFSIASFVFHLTRFTFAGDLRKDFVEEAARQVQDQDKVIQTILASSRKQLDQAISHLSIDTHIPDLAFRLWTRTDLARYGVRSSLEIYSEEGGLLNRFSVNLPQLPVSLDIVLEGGWGTERQSLRLENERKPVYFSVRDIPGVGFLVLEATQDFEFLPFLAPTNPFLELFRFPEQPGSPTPELNIYDEKWRPVFVSRSDLSISTQKGKEIISKGTPGWVPEKWSGRTYDVFYFPLGKNFGALIIPGVAIYSHLVHLIDLLLMHLLWLSIFTLVLVTFFRSYLALHFRSQTVAELNFFQKMLIAFVVFSMVPIVSFSLVMRSYAREKQIEEVTSRALNSFSVATRMIGEYLSFQEGQQRVSREELFSNTLLEWISQVTQQDVTFYYKNQLLTSSNRELYTAGLLSLRMPGQTYVDLFLKGQKYSINEARVGEFRFLNVSGRLYTDRYRDEVIVIPFLMKERSLQEEIMELREYMILTGAGLVFLAVLLGYFLANRFSQPVEVLIQGTGEMSRGNLQYRIQEQYRDEFRLLVNSFNAMADSLSEQRTALDRRRAYIENILNNITTAVVSVDNTIHITTFNPAAASLFKLPASCSERLESLVPNTSEWESVLAVLRAFTANPQKFGVQEVAVSRDQQELHWRMTWVPLFAEGEWNGAVLLVEDITDIIRSNRLSAWAEMARRVAHEVKNPLTPIQLAVEHLVRVYEDQSENFGEVLHACSDAVLKQVKTLRRLVSDFSQYGRPAVLNRTEVELDDFLNELISHYRFPEGITVQTNIPESLPRVRMDTDKVRGALMNIIENGLQAVNGKGSISLKAERTQNSSVRIQIQDTGRGVPPDILPRLFEPYFSTKSGGTGLGLAIARKNIEDHGGRIQVESKEGQGTTVTITLPV